MVCLGRQQGSQQCDAPAAEVLGITSAKTQSLVFPSFALGSGGSTTFFLRLTGEGSCHQLLLPGSLA